MTLEDRVDQLEAQVIASRIALQLLARDATAETLADIRAAADSVESLGLAEPLTNRQIAQIRARLVAMASE
jgi:hypothetical protein